MKRAFAIILILALAFGVAACAPKEYAGGSEASGSGSSASEPAYIADEEAAVFLYRKQDGAAGFAHCQLRHDYVEGTESSPVGYLEGIYVKEACRGEGIARKLLAACEDWAREKGCTEFASDCELTNIVSQNFHRAVGFEEANRLVEYVRKI